MTAPTEPTIPVLGASVPARNWIYEVNTGTSAAAVWTGIGGVQSSTFNPDSANWVDDSDYAGQGYSSQTKSATAWSFTATLRRAPQQGVSPAAYDEGQEYLRTHAIGVLGPANTVQLRMYEYDPNDPAGDFSPRVEAYMGFAGISWEPQGGDDKALQLVNVTVNSQGKLNVISHPFPVTAGG